MSAAPRSHPFRHRRGAAVLLVALLALTSAACVRGEGSSEGASSDGDGDASSTSLPECPVGALDEADGTVEIDVWHTMVAETQNNLIELTEQYNASQDKVRVNLQSQGVDYREGMRKFVAGIPSRQLPAVVHLQEITLRQLVDSGTIMPAEACEQADGFSTGQIPAVRNYYSSDGVYWPSFPTVSVPVLYYNANHFRRAGLDPDDPPTTLAEIMEASRALKDAGIAAPLALNLNSWFVETWVTGAGATVVNNDNGRDGLADESTFDNETTREVYAWLQEMDAEGLLDAYSNTDGQINHYLAVAQQNSSMVVETSTSATTIKAVLGGEDFEDEADGIDVGEVDLSAIDPGTGAYPGVEEASQVRVSGGAFYLTNTGTDAEIAAAWDYMKFMWETDSQVAWHLVGSYLPTTQTAAGAPEVVEYWENDLAGRALKVGYDQLLQIDADRPGPQIGPYGDFEDAVDNSLDRLILQGDSVDAAVSSAHSAIQEILERYAEDYG